MALAASSFGETEPESTAFTQSALYANRTDGEELTHLMVLLDDALAVKQSESVRGL